MLMAVIRYSDGSSYDGEVDEKVIPNGNGLYVIDDMNYYDGIWKNGVHKHINLKTKERIHGYKEWSKAKTMFKFSGFGLNNYGIVGYYDKGLLEGYGESIFVDTQIPFKEGFYLNGLKHGRFIEDGAATYYTNGKTNETRFSDELTIIDGKYASYQIEYNIVYFGVKEQITHNNITLCRKPYFDGSYCIGKHVDERRLGLWRIIFEDGDVRLETSGKMLSNNDVKRHYIVDGSMNTGI